MFNMSSIIVLDNSFKMLSPFIDALVNINLYFAIWQHKQTNKQKKCTEKQSNIWL